MHLLDIIRRDVFSKFAGEVFSKALFLLFFFYAGRKLGTVEFGALNLAISTAYILGVLFLDPGLNLSTIQLLVARPDQSPRIASAILSFKTVLFLPLLLVAFSLRVAWGSRLPSFAALLSASLFVLFTALLEYLCSVTNAYHRMDYEAFFKIFNRVCIVLFGLVALRVGRMEAILWAMSVATLLACVLAFFVLRKQLVLVRFGWDWGIILETLKAGLPIAGTLVVGTIYLKWDLLVLSYFNIGQQQIGWYAAAFKILEASFALPGILGAALFPIILQLREQNPKALDRLLLATTKTVLLFSIPVAATISLFSERIISVVYGNGYLPAAGVLSILIWCIVPIFLYFYLMFVNVATGHAKANLLAGCVALAVGLLANAVLVPSIGYVGAAWSALVANSCFAVLATWKVCALFSGARIPAMLLKLFAAGSLMALVGVYAPVPLAVQVGAGLFVYIAVLVTSGAIGVEDFSLVVRVFQVRVQPQTQP